ncbi:uncharacterized protein IWZ02DRAFT_8119 [Phyllosticta citriasiana]|uniref:uncharacterized protein n=1 Tax=Phyllosticta citriasiana TaxID=595635 RepID=UPI0030FDDDAA
MKHLDLPSVMLLVLNVLLSCLVLEVAKTESVRTKGLRSYAGQESGGSGKFPWEDGSVLFPLSFFHQPTNDRSFGLGSKS